MIGRVDVGSLADVEQPSLPGDVSKSYYDESGNCPWCSLKVAGEGGSSGDRTHDAECALLLARLGR